MSTLTLDTALVGEIVQDKIKPGDRLRNGFLVVAVAPAPTWDNSETKAVVVLATDGREYASWITGEADLAGTCMGRYSMGTAPEDFARAVTIFVERAR